MNTISVPSNLIKEKELVVISRREYEQFLRLSKKIGGTEANLRRHLNKLVAECKTGKSIGPFVSTKSLKKSLEK